MLNLGSSEILAGVDDAVKAGIQSIKFNSVLLKQFNYQELSTFFDYLKEHPVTWRFIELMQTGNNKIHREETFSNQRYSSCSVTYGF